MDPNAVFIDPGSRDRLTLRFGDQVQDWFEALPGVLETLSERWRLEVGHQIPRGSVSAVFRCRMADGLPAVLKVSPDRARLALEAAVLRAWTTVHVPEVIRFDEELGALLIAAIDPGTPLSLTPDVASAEAVTELVRALHDGKRDPSFPTVEQRVDDLFRSSEKLCEQDAGLGEVISPELYQRGRALAERLAGDESRDVLLHGDLTPDNILNGGEVRGLVAIDPAPCIGDAAFDLVDLILWRADDLASIEARTARLCASLDIDPAAAMSWCIAFAGMNALELASDGGQPKRVRVLADLAASAYPS